MEGVKEASLKLIAVVLKLRPSLMGSSTFKGKKNIWTLCVNIS